MENLVRASEEAGVSRFVHFSSMFVMTSCVWPSAMNPEITPVPDPKEWPFPAFCRSKLESEKILLDSGRGSWER